MRKVSVPSSGDYQFLPILGYYAKGKVEKFPSPHPGIINFFSKKVVRSVREKKFPSPHPGIINFFLKDQAYD